ncbi:trichohyalin-like isoform X1, partial [Clarias magur]
MDFSTLPVLLGFRELLLCVITAGVLAVACFCAGYELGRDERSAHTVRENGPGRNVSSGLPHSSDETRDRPASKGSLDDESGIQGNMKKSYVMKLENRVTALEELFCGIRSETEIKSKDLDRERQIHSTLKEKYEDTLMQNEALENDCELMFQTERANFLEKMLYMVAGQSDPDRERHADSTLNEKYDEMTDELDVDEDHELFQKDRANNLEKMLFARITQSGFKSEEPKQQTDSIPMETYDEPSKQNQDLQRDVNNETENTHFMKEKLVAADGQSEDLEERLPYCVLKMKYEELVKQNEQLYRSYELLDQGDRGIYVDETLDDAVAGHSEQNHEVALANPAEVNAPSSLEYRENPTHVNSRLNDQVLQLTNLVRSQRSRLCDTEEMCANLIRALEQSQERQDYTHLWSQYEDSVATVANAKSITKDALEANTRLEYEKSVLIKHMELLAGTVGKMQEELCKTHKSHVKLFKSTLALENIKLRERVKTLQEKLGEENLKMPEEKQEEQEKECLDHHNILSQHEDIT